MNITQIIIAKRKIFEYNNFFVIYVLFYESICVKKLDKDSKNNSNS